MTPLLMGVLLAGAAGLAGLLVKRLIRPKNTSIDVGAVSESWLSEERAGKRDERYM